MKKIALLLAIAAAFATFAAFDFAGARAVPVLNASTTVNAGTTNVTEITAAGLRGNAALFVTANGNASRTALNLSLWTTNTVEGGWVEFASETLGASRDADLLRSIFSYSTFDWLSMLKAIPIARTAMIAIRAIMIYFLSI